MFGKIFRSPVTTIVLFVIAAGLILSSSIGGTMAILNIQSDDYLAEIKLDELDVGLTETCYDGVARVIPNSPDLYNPAAGEALIEEQNLIPKGESFTPGKEYVEKLAVINNSAIPEYVRVSVYKYWEKDGKKDVSLDPDLIELGFVTDSGWVIDPDASTSERTVLYYSGGPVAPGGSTPNFTDTFKVSTSAIDSMYAGASCHIACVVDGVQNHNAAAAITSAWGHNFLGIQ